MRRIETRLDIHSDEFRANAAHNLGIAAELRARQHRARLERPQRDLDRLARQNKMFVRDRIEMLLDPGTPFLELSTLAANMDYDGDVPGAGNISGIGIVAGREVIIRADDASVKGGAWYPLTIKKMVRTLDIAIENRLPVIHICDSAGGFLPPQAELFADRYYAGRIFRNQAILSKMGVPQVALVMGHCTAGGAYIPGAERIQRDRARHRRHLPRRPAAGESRDRRGRDRRRTRRRRRAYADFGNGGLSGSQRTTGDRNCARDRRPVPPRRKVRDRAHRSRAAALRPAGAVRHHSARHQSAVRHARGDCTHRRRQPLPRIPARLRHHAGLRLRAYLRLQGRHPRQQRRAVQRLLAEGRAFHAALQPEPHADDLSCRTSPATWSAASTSTAASPRTAPR